MTRYLTLTLASLMTLGQRAMFGIYKIGVTLGQNNHLTIAVVHQILLTSTFPWGGGHSVSPSCY